MKYSHEYPRERRNSVSAEIQWDGSAHTGTRTTQASRDFVNSPAQQAIAPEQVEVEVYANGHRIYRFTASNPALVDVAGASIRDDAGHLVGQQLGGSGRDGINLIAQNYQINRGNAGTFSEWRAQENHVLNLLSQHNALRLRFNLPY